MMIIAGGGDGGGGDGVGGGGSATTTGGGLSGTIASKSASPRKRLMSDQCAAVVPELFPRTRTPTLRTKSKVDATVDPSLSRRHGMVTTPKGSLL